MISMMMKKKVLIKTLNKMMMIVVAPLVKTLLAWMKSFRRTPRSVERRNLLQSRKIKSQMNNLRKTDHLVPIIVSWVSFQSPPKTLTNDIQFYIN